MSKTKQWAADVAEKAVDKILLQVKQNLITKETASANILNTRFSSSEGCNSKSLEVFAL